MSTLAEADKGYLSSDFSDGAAVAAADYTGDSLTLSELSAYALPPGLAEDPADTATLQRSSALSNKATYSLDASSSELRTFVRGLFGYSKEPAVVSKRQVKDGTKQVRTAVAGLCRLTLALACTAYPAYLWRQRCCMTNLVALLRCLNECGR